MSDEKPNQDRAVRSVAIDMAIRANCGQCYDQNERIIYDARKIIKAAVMFEEFIKGVKPFVEGVSNNPKNPETKFKKEW
jgi:hypothetical protein